MELLAYLLLSVANLLIIARVLYLRNPISSEGWCATFVFVSVLSDTVELLVRYNFWPDGLLRGPTGELRLRLYPTFVHIVGMASLLLGLSLVDPRPRRVVRTLTAGEQRHLRQIGIAVVIIGLTLYGTGMFLMGIQYAGGFADMWTSYRVGGADSRFGSFWYTGMHVAILGLGLLFVTGRGFGRLLPGVAAILLTTLATGNKGGLEQVLFYCAALGYLYQRKAFARLFKQQATWTIGLPLAVMSVVAVIGVKNYFLTGEQANLRNQALPSGLDTVRARYSSEGLYHGYSLMVSNLRNGSGEMLQGRVLRYTATGWVPRLLFPDKLVHPFWGLGYIIYEDQHVYEQEAPAPTLVGYAYLDGGLWTTVLYLGVGGVLLGALRRRATRPRGSLYWHFGYVFFCLFPGCSAEAGLLGIGDTGVLAAAVMMLAWLVVFFMSTGNTKEIYTKRWLLTRSAVVSPRILLYDAVVQPRIQNLRGMKTDLGDDPNS